MTDKKKYFNVDEFHNWKKTVGKNSLPPRANFLAAANHMRNLFEKNKIAWGVLGGMEMLCLGYRREMPDLHIAYDYRDFAQIKARLIADRRVRIQDSMNPLFTTKILVQTGPDHTDIGCTHTAFVEVNLIPPGICGTPPTDALGSNLVLLNLNADGKQKTYKGLNMLYLMNTLVHFCKARGLVWDPRKDIVFLCQKYGEDVQHIRSKLNQKDVQEHFLGTPFFSRLPSEDQHRCYLILLDTQPPPMMAITPPVASPVHKYSASASDSIKPRILLHKSSPSLNAHWSSENLNLPVPGQSHLHAPKSDHQPHAPATTQSHIQSDQSTTSRDSRSRYRTISAPNSRDNSLGGPQMRPKSMDLRHLQQEPSLPSSQGRIANMSSVVSSTPQQQIVSSFYPVPMIAEARKSMPNLNTFFAGPNPPYGFTQTHHAQQNLSLQPTSISGIPESQNPGQRYLKSQLGLAGDGGYGQMGPPVPITVNPRRPQARASSHGSHFDKLTLSETPIPKLSEPKLGHSRVVESEEIATPFTQVAEESSQPVVNKPYTFGEEGLYASSHEASSDVHSEYEVSLRPHPLFSSKSLPPLASQPASFVAELPADQNTAMEATSSTPLSFNRLSNSSIFLQTETGPARKGIEHNSKPTLKDTPASPPYITTPSYTLPTASRPSNPRTQSAPLGALPASLTAGGAHSRHHSPQPSISISHSPPQPTPHTQTKTSKYTRYYANPQNFAPQNPPQSQSAYQAYHLPAPRPEIPHSKTEPARQNHSTIDTWQAEDQPEPLHHHPFDHMRDVDRKDEYLEVQEHKRNTSHESAKSQGSDQWAEEYRLELPEFGDFHGGEEEERT